MKTSLLKKLTLVAVIASAFAITGCKDANSKNAAAEATGANVEAASAAAPKAQTSEEAKREAEAGNAFY